MSLSLLGLLLGFAGALFQAWNYALTKDVQEKYDLSGIRLLGASHLFMGVVCLVPFIFLGYYRFIDASSLLFTFFVVALDLLAQYFINKAIGYSDSSVVAPLLAVKIPILAFISVLFLDKGFSIQQIFAITLIISVGWYYSSLSGKLGFNSLICVMLGCVSFCLSDISLTVGLMPYLKNIGVGFWLDQVLIASVLEYIFCVIPAVPMLFLARGHRLNITVKNVWDTRFIVFAWLASTICIVSCYNLSGVVEGNIIQSLRGVFGVLIAYFFYKKYIQDPSLLRKKVFIALVMFMAVAIYHL